MNWNGLVEGLNAGVQSGLKTYGAVQEGRMDQARMAYQMRALQMQEQQQQRRAQLEEQQQQLQGEQQRINQVTALTNVLKIPHAGTRKAALKIIGNQFGMANDDDQFKNLLDLVGQDDPDMLSALSGAAQEAGLGGATAKAILMATRDDPSEALSTILKYGKATDQDLQFEERMAQNERRIALQLARAQGGGQRDPASQLKMLTRSRTNPDGTVDQWQEPLVYQPERGGIGSLSEIQAPGGAPMPREAQPVAPAETIGGMPSRDMGPASASQNVLGLQQKPAPALSESEGKNVGFLAGMQEGERSINNFLATNPDYLNSTKAKVDQGMRNVGEQGKVVGGGVGTALGAALTRTWYGAIGGGGAGAAVGEIGGTAIEQWLTSDEGKAYSAAIEPFVNSALYKRTGAQINKEEWVKAFREWIPVPGDPDSVIEQKARNRSTAMQGAAAGAGRGPSRLEAQTNPVAAAARQAGVDPSVLHSLILKESGGDQSAIGDGGKAIGFGQLHPGAAIDAGIDPSQRKDPHKNLQATAGYFGQMLKRASGDVRLGLAYYNQGPNATGEALKKGYAYADSVLGSIPGKAQTKTRTLTPFAEGEFKSLAAKIRSGTALPEERQKFEAYARAKGYDVTK